MPLTEHICPKFFFKLFLLVFQWFFNFMNTNTRIMKQTAKHAKHKSPILRQRALSVRHKYNLYISCIFLFIVLRLVIPRLIISYFSVKHELLNLQHSRDTSCLPVSNWKHVQIRYIISRSHNWCQCQLHNFFSRRKTVLVGDLTSLSASTRTSLRAEKKAKDQKKATEFTCASYSVQFFPLLDLFW